jgi:lipopolysaccharide transport system permease protein
LETRELWSFRELALFLALRDLKLRYRQTFFGVAWALVQPLAGVAVFSIVFGDLASVPSDGIPYPVFVFAGLVVWTYVSTAVEQAAKSLVENVETVTKVYFPRVLAPVAAVLPGLLDLAVSLVVVAVFMVAYDVVPNAAVLLLPIELAAAVGVATAIGLWLAALNVRYRDVRYALTFLVQLWFFATPVVYSSSVFEGTWRYVFAANPMVGVLDSVRWSLLAGPAPGPQDLISLAAGLLLLVGGLAYFQAADRRFADVV